MLLQYTCFFQCERSSLRMAYISCYSGKCQQSKIFRLSVPCNFGADNPPHNWYRDAAYEKCFQLALHGQERHSLKVFKGLRSWFSFCILHKPRTQESPGMELSAPSEKTFGTPVECLNYGPAYAKPHEYAK